MNPLGILKSVALQNLAISIAASRCKFLSCILEPWNFRKLNGIYLGVVVTRNVPFDDPEVTKYCRMFYYTVQLVVISTLYFIKGKVCSCTRDSCDELV